MNIGSTQRQALVASMQFSSGSVKKESTVPKIGGAIGVAALDAVEVGQKVDGDFANRVLQDSLEERLNSALQQAGVEMSASELLTSGVDFSPEATASRIVDFAVSFYGSYQANNHQEDEGGLQLDGFVSRVKGAVEEGFAGAQEVLSGFGEMSDQVQGNIDETFSLTMKGIDDFAQEQRQLAEAGVEEESATAI